MFVTREQIIKRLAEKSGYYKQDIRALMKCLDTVVLECFDEVTDDEDVVIQLVQGVKISAHVVPQRDRVDPRNGAPIVCKATVKPACKFSEDFRGYIQNSYEDKKDG